MQYKAEDIPREISSQLWSSVVSPRPVSLIVSRSKEGLSNIAAYSSVALISVYPPILSVSIGQRKGKPKNTLINILETKQFSVNFVHRELIEIANESAEGSDTVDDFLRLKLTPNKFDSSFALAIDESPASIACELIQTVEIEGVASTLLLAKCQEIAVKDEYLTNGSFDTVCANMVASIGLINYVSLAGKEFTLPKTWE